MRSRLALSPRRRNCVAREAQELGQECIDLVRLLMREPMRSLFEEHHACVVAQIECWLNEFPAKKGVLGSPRQQSRYLDADIRVEFFPTAWALLRDTSAASP